MKKIFIATLLGLAYLGSKAQVRHQSSSNVKAAAQQIDFEKIKISFPQSPLMHDDGGWEKGPSNWATATKYPVVYRGGLLFLDRKRNGIIKYLMVEIKFIEAGTIQFTANSSANDKAGINGWKTLFGKAGEVMKQTIICTENSFGSELTLYLKNFRPYRQSYVN